MNVNEMVYLTTARSWDAIEVLRTAGEIGELRNLEPESPHDLIRQFNAITAAHG